MFCCSFCRRICLGFSRVLPKLFHTQSTNVITLAPHESSTLDQNLWELSALETYGQGQDKERIRDLLRASLTIATQKFVRNFSVEKGKKLLSDPWQTLSY